MEKGQAGLDPRQVTAGADGLAASLPARKNPASRLRSAGVQLLQLVAVSTLAFGSYFVISRFFLQSVTIMGISMAPTLADSERYLLNRWVYYVRSPQRDDLVVLRDPADAGYSVKRIVAVEGDVVSLKDGVLYINGRKAVEPYLRPGTPTFAAAPRREQTYNCESGQFFVLGDNRNNSVDSRVYGPVPRHSIIGLIIK